MKYILKTSLFVASSLLIVACGSTNTNSTKITTTSTKNILNSTKDTLKMDFSLTNSYASNVKVQIKDFVLDVAPCVIQNSTFSPSDFTFENQKTVNIHVEAKFTEECVPESYYLTGKTFLTEDGETIEVPLNTGKRELNATTEGTTAGTGGSASGTDAGIPTVTPIVVIPNALKEIKLTTNSKSIEIPIKVFNETSPYTKGSVKVELPSKVLAGADVGMFSAYEVPVNSQGVALFNYTGPSNLKALVQANDLSSVFKFYHTQNAKNKQELKVSYSIKEDTYVPVEYSLDVSTQDSDFSMGIPNVQKTLSVNLKDSDGKNINNADVKITKIEVASENTLVVKIIDPNSGSSVNSLILDNINSSSFVLVSKKLSGIAPIRINMEFIDNNKKAQKLSKVINVRVMSGLPSAISISYVGTGHDASRAKYEEKIAVSVTDEYGNKVNTRPYISLGALVGYAVDGSASSDVESNETKRLYYGKSDIESGRAEGIINPLGDDIANTTNFEDSKLLDVFKWVNAEGANSDKLVVFGKGKNYEAMGKWDFSKIDNNTLKLADDYFGQHRGELSYAIGRNYYQDQCYDDGREWIGSTDAESYQLDEEGTVVVSYKYDYHLTGKEALIWVNLSGYQSDTEKNTRIGEVTKHTLRGKGLISRPSGGYFVDKNSTAIVTFDIHHENAPEWYRNGHFAYDVLPNKCASVVEIDSINHHDARSCNNEGIAYVTFEVTAPEDADCNFNINNILVKDEF